MSLICFMRIRFGLSGDELRGAVSERVAESLGRGRLVYRDLSFDNLLYITSSLTIIHKINFMSFFSYEKWALLTQNR
ncbi:MAG: hypothetical protein ACI9CD_001065 [Candidatus Deianiraeaceae bacterium]|jgi:hypothetical protein